MCLIPPIEKMDSSLNTLVAVKHLSLSTNCIDKMISLPNLKNLEVLSLGRNQIKKLSGLEEIGATLRELWISYNSISTLDGLHPCVKLQTLYMSNNKIKSWDELTKLTQLPELKNLLLVGNPIYEGFSKKEVCPMVLKRLPNLGSLDGEMITGDSMVDEVLEKVKNLMIEKYGDIESAFKALTVDHAAGLDQAEFMAAIAPLGFSDGEAEEVFKHVDEDHSGEVSMQEFLNALS